MSLGLSVVNFLAFFYNTGQFSSLRSYALEFSHYMDLYSISSISKYFHLNHVISIAQQLCDVADVVLCRSPKFRDLLKTMKLVEKLIQKSR